MTIQRVEGLATVPKTSAENTTYTGQNGEIVNVIDGGGQATGELRVHDGVTIGGIPVGNTLQIQFNNITSSAYSTSVASFVDIPTFFVSITPKNTSSIFRIDINIGAVGGNGTTLFKVICSDANGNSPVGDGASGSVQSSFKQVGLADTNHSNRQLSYSYIDSSSHDLTTRTYKLQWHTQSGLQSRLNRSTNIGSTSYLSTTASTIIVTEVLL